MEPEKYIECKLCGSEELTAYFYFVHNNKPAISFDCAKCKEPILGFSIPIEALKFVLDTEDMLQTISEEK